MSHDRKTAGANAAAALRKKFTHCGGTVGKNKRERNIVLKSTWKRIFHDGAGGTLCARRQGGSGEVDKQSRGGSLFKNMPQQLRGCRTSDARACTLAPSANNRGSVGEWARQTTLNKAGRRHCLQVSTGTVGIISSYVAFSPRMVVICR